MLLDIYIFFASNTDAQKFCFAIYISLPFSIYELLWHAWAVHTFKTLIENLSIDLVLGE